MMTPLFCTQCGKPAGQVNWQEFDWTGGQVVRVLCPECVQRHLHGYPSDIIGPVEITEPSKIIR